MSVVSISLRLSVFDIGFQVLLYKFFEDSKVDLSQWRVVLNLVDQASKGLAVPRFDEERHAGVCSEVCYRIQKVATSGLTLYCRNYS